MLHKNEEIVVTVDDIGKDGEGIGHYDGYALFIKGALPGETVRALVTKANKKYGFARLLEVVMPATDRVTPPCPVASPCGGCSLLHMSYEAQLRAKEKKVKDCLIRIGGIHPEKVEWLPIIGMEDPWYYRNKAQFPVREDSEGRAQAGFFAGHSHRLIPVADCMIQHPIINETMNVVVSFLREYGIAPYNEERHTGLIRHIYIRMGYHTGQVMVCLVVTKESLPHAEELLDRLRHISGMTSICLNINPDKTNVILGKRMVPLFGEPYIEDSIGDIHYRISPASFYQVNPIQTERLYATALSFADLTGDENVWDLYCGIGTISLYLARQAGSVIGVEIVPEAVEDARENARRNGIHNATFYCGASEDILTSERFVSAEHVDVVVVDPPRKGCDVKLLSTMLKMAPEKIVYVSCDPATLARDVKVMCESGYSHMKVRPCDMFPGSGHVETVVLMSRNDTQ